MELEHILVTPKLTSKPENLWEVTNFFPPCLGTFFTQSNYTLFPCDFFINDCQMRPNIPAYFI